MKKNKFALLAALLFLFSCSSNYHWKLKIEVPGEAVLDLDQFKELVITNFLIKRETKDINLSQEILDYFNFEIGQKFNGRVISKNISFTNKEAFKNEDFWKDILEDSKNALFFTGSADYTEEIRKAILEERRRERFEEPFTSGKKLAERKFYTLNFDLYLINAKSGETLYKRSFKETSGYKNPNQTAYFAFFDLIQRVKVKLFRNILGGKKIEERYIIIE